MRSFAAADPGKELLFDNVADPYQMRNLIAEPSHSKRADNYRKMLRRKMHELNDTFPASTWYRGRWTDGKRRIVASARGPFSKSV